MAISERALGLVQEQETRVVYQPLVRHKFPEQRTDMVGKLYSMRMVGTLPAKKLDIHRKVKSGI